MVGVVHDVLVVFHGPQRIILGGKNSFLHTQRLIKHRLLPEVRHADTLAAGHEPGIGVFQPGEDAHEGRFARPIDAHKGNALPQLEPEVKVLKQPAVGVVLRDILGG